ncbi:hypothetical protein IT414_00475 [bacterium]|nr:hypothetical protein [bacterium]
MTFVVIELICAALAVVFHRAGMRTARNRAIGAALIVIVVLVFVILDSGGAHLN